MKLKNLLRQMRSFNLEHATFLEVSGEHPAGKPETLTLLPLEIREVHEDAIQCVEIKSALNPSKGRPTLRILG